MIISGVMIKSHVSRAARSTLRATDFHSARRIATLQPSVPRLRRRIFGSLTESSDFEWQDGAASPYVGRADASAR